MIELGKQYRTRDGREVRIYAVDGGGPKPIHGARRADGGYWVHECWTESGSAQHGCVAMLSPFDLIEVKPEMTVRRFLGLANDGQVWALLDANDTLGTTRIGAIDITHDGEKLLKVEVVK